MLERRTPSGVALLLGPDQKLPVAGAPQLTPVGVMVSRYAPSPLAWSSSFCCCLVEPPAGGSTSLEFARHVSQHPTNDQSTAQHHDGGWLLLWGKNRKVSALRERLSVTEVAPALLSLYGIEPQPWQTLDAPAFALS